MPEIPDRLCDDETARMPAAMSGKLYYTATATGTYFGMGVCNTAVEDVHVSVFLIPAGVSWVSPSPGPAYTTIVSRQRVEGDDSDGNVWEMPVIVLKQGDRIVVWTDVFGATFNAHGIKMIEVTV
jgi:hypothetical protein